MSQDRYRPCRGKLLHPLVHMKAKDKDSVDRVRLEHPQVRVETEGKPGQARSGCSIHPLANAENENQPCHAESVTMNTW